MALHGGSDKVEKMPKGTSIGRGRFNISGLNKHKKRSYKKYRGQGR
jgi:hypothetical protein